MTTADAAATELVKLYVQKGHNPIACSRFLKRKSADYGDLCVSNPVPKGSPPPSQSPLFHKQGATAPFISLWPTKLLMIGEDMNLGRQVHVPAFLFNC